MKIFRASQSSVVHIEAVLTSIANQSPVWPAKLFERFIDTVVCMRCLSQSFRHHVDLLCQKSYKNSSLLGYFDCFLSDHTVGYCNISFSCLSQIRREKFCFASKVFILLLYFFAWLQLFRCHIWPTFHPATPNFFVLAQLFMLIACWKTNFFRMFMGNYCERNREREMFRLTRFPVIESKSFALFCALNPTFFCSSRTVSLRNNRIKSKLTVD